MTNRESKFSRPSAATHRLTQASTTLNRRYVKRPTVIAINQTSSDAKKSQPAPEKSTPAATRTPQAAPGTSRLVNLGVHAKDLPRPVPPTAWTQADSSRADLAVCRLSVCLLWEQLLLTHWAV